MLTFCGIRLHVHQGVFTSPVEFLRRKGVKTLAHADVQGREHYFLTGYIGQKIGGEYIYPCTDEGDCVFVSPGARELTGECTWHKETDTTATATERLRIVVAHQRPAAVPLGSESGAAMAAASAP